MQKVELSNTLTFIRQNYQIQNYLLKIAQRKK